MSAVRLRCCSLLVLAGGWGWSTATVPLSACSCRSTALSAVLSPGLLPQEHPWSHHVAQSSVGNCAAVRWRLCS